MMISVVDPQMYMYISIHTVVEDSRVQMVIAKLILSDINTYLSDKCAIALGALCD